MLVAITLKPMIDVRYADALVYMATIKEDDSPRYIPIDSQEEPSITLEECDLRETFMASLVFFTKKYNKSFNIQQVFTRKRRRELGDDPTDRTSIEVTPLLDLLDIQLPILTKLPLDDDDDLESIDMAVVNMGVVENGLGEDA